MGHPFVLVTCVAKGTPPFRFQWLKEGSEVINSERIAIKSDTKFSTLEIRNIEGDDRGNYSCLVSNPAGSDSFESAFIIKREVYFVRVAFAESCLV